MHTQRLIVRIAGVVLVALCLTCSARPQTVPIAARAVEPPAETGTPAPDFEVVAIKPSDPATCCARGISRKGPRFSTRNTTPKALIQWAYSLYDGQIVGGPAWLDQTHFDIFGESQQGTMPTDRQWKVALQQLLADRFQLRFHQEVHEQAAYALVVAKGGPKLNPTDFVTAHNPDHIERMAIMGSAEGHVTSCIGINASMSDFVGELQRAVLDRPLIDRTGLTGRYDFACEFTQEGAAPADPSPAKEDPPPGLFDALPIQLGLKLETTRAPVDVMVIDSATPPVVD